jgi:transmembrane sensor
MNAKKLGELLQKYRDGQCTEEERYLIEKFYQGFDAIDDQLPGSAEMQPHYDTLYQQVLQQVTVTPVERKQRPVYRKLVMAAAILLLCGLATWRFLLPEKKINNIATHKVEKVKKRFIKLADGSAVLLNAHSELKYPQAFSGNTREVYLTGEAYFDIVADSRQPFIVHTGEVSTTVLGTVFNIKAWSGESQVTVTVTRGSVKVAAGGKQIGVINANQQISVDQSAAQISKNDTVNVQPVVNWIQEDIIFSNVTYAAAAKVLSEKYGVQVVFRDNDLQDCRFTTSFKNQSSLEDILTVLCAFNQSSFNIKDSIVTISGGSCQ